MDTRQEQPELKRRPVWACANPLCTHTEMSYRIWSDGACHNCHQHLGACADDDCPRCAWMMAETFRRAGRDIPAGLRTLAELAARGYDTESPIVKLAARQPAADVTLSVKFHQRNVDDAIRAIHAAGGTIVMVGGVERPCRP